MILRLPQRRQEPAAVDVDDLSVEALVVLLESFEVERRRLCQAIDDAEEKARGSFERHEARGVQEHLAVVERSRERLADLKLQEQNARSLLDRRVGELLAEWQTRAETTCHYWQKEQNRILDRVNTLILELEICLGELAAIPSQVAEERERLLRERAAIVARAGRFASSTAPPVVDVPAVDAVALGERLSALAQRT